MLKQQSSAAIVLFTATLVIGLAQAAPYYQNNTLAPYVQDNTGYTPSMQGNTGYAPTMQGNTGYAPTMQGNTGYTPAMQGNTGYTPAMQGNTGYAPAMQPPAAYPSTGMGNTPSMQYQPSPVFQQGMMQNQPQNYNINPIYVVRALPMNNTVKLGGTVIPFKDVTLSAQIPGRIEFIAGSEGDFLEKGQVLVTIDDDDLIAQRRAALAELTNAQAAIRNAQVQYSRELISPQSRNINRSPGMGMPSMFDQFFTRGMGDTMGMGNSGMDRHADLYSRGTAVNTAQSRMLRARSKLEEVDAKIRDSRSVAPFSGLIVKKLVEVGDTVQPGQPLLNFADTKALQLQVDVPARLMPGIQPGMIVDAKLDVGNKHIKAKVAQIFPMADVQRHTVTVKFDLPEGVPGGPGMYAEVIVPNISAPSRNVIIVPATAVRQRGSLYVVYRLNDKNEPVIRYVRLGEKINENMVTVLSGLQNNDSILVNPMANINRGLSPVSSGQNPVQR
jgi:RND family efflux transporter MFP subunit